MRTEGRTYKRPESRFIWLEYPGPHGRKVRRSSGTTNEKEARAELVKAIERAHSISFKEAVEDFFTIKERSLRTATLQNYRGSLRAVHPLLGDKCLEEIDADLLKEFIRHRRRTVSDVAVKRDLAFVSSVFSHVMETLPKAPKYNPVIHLSKKGLVENTRLRWLRPTEYERLLGACTNSMQRLIIETATHTGMRHRELTGLRKPMINFKRKEVVLDDVVNKNKRERIVPLCEPLCSKLEELCAWTPGDTVFCYAEPVSQRWQPYTNFSNFWRRARQRADLEDVRFHDLRHTFASWFVQAGGGLLPLRDILGHSSLQMVQRYAHLNTAAHHSEIRRVFKHTLNTDGGNDEHSDIVSA